MPVIRVSTDENTPQTITRDVLTDPVMRAKQGEGELGTAVRRYHPGGAEELQMFEVTVEPDAVIGQHAHLEDEIVYVVEGELVLGKRVLTAGASVYIPGQTLYTFRAGPRGLRFLNFRARRDISYLTKEEWRDLSRRTAAAEASSTVAPAG